MERNLVLEMLRVHRADLNALGVKSLAVFGSVARGEARPESDVDILVDFHQSATFDGYMQTKFYLEDLLGCPIDLVVRQAVKPRMLPVVEREAIYVA